MEARASAFTFISKLTVTKMICRAGKIPQGDTLALHKNDLKLSYYFDEIGNGV